MPRQSNPLRKIATLFLIAAAFCTLMIAASMPARSDTTGGSAAAADRRDEHQWSVSLLGVRAGTVRLSAEQRGGSYRVDLDMRSEGAGAAIRRVRFVAGAEGRISSGRYAPALYDENADTGRRQSRSTIEYRRGIPRITAYESTSDHRLNTLDPATQAGTLDPATSFYAILRDQPRASACTAAVVTFDGRRRTQTRLADPHPEGERITCRGEYRRLDGFRPEDMAERSRFPFTVIYEPTSDGLMRVAEVRVQTLYGAAVMKRR
ncbi:MAG TPA: DUF3108 domain-containing protein [Paracoccaceae bacterium]|nr:DUF3108 domain-containing protein [Paracoccaceae bacterium]HMO72124.1 DUF3108 domain-containing protein [Paracoccaceae bacterium]